MNYCGPEGSIAAKLVIIGEAPGKRELELGQPFIGPSGNLLWKLLSQIGISRSDCYITNVIKTYAPQSPLYNLPQAELEMWQELLLAELAQTRATLYVALGQTALWALTGETKIDNWRGTVLVGQFETEESNVTHLPKVFTTFHPARLIYNPSDLYLFKSDIQKLFIEYHDPDFYSPDESGFIIYPNLEQALVYIEECKSYGKISVDIETSDGIPTCVGLSHTVGSACCIPLLGKNYWKAEEYIRVTKELNTLLNDSSITKIGQNISYDAIGLRCSLIDIKPPFRDTMLEYHSIDPLAEKKLGQQSALFTRNPFWKDWDIAPAGAYAEREERLFTYNCRDCSVTLELDTIYQKHYPERMQFYDDFYAQLQPVLIDMYFNGISVDSNLQLSLAKTYTQDANDIVDTIALGFGIKPFNINSPVQMKKILYDVLKMPKQFRRQRSGPSKLVVDDEALVNIYIQTQNPFVQLIREAKEKLKFASFLSPSSKDAKLKRRSWDGRLRCEYSQNTQTGRLRSHASQGTKIGINLQQIPSAIKQTFIPAEGSIFIEFDYSQAEARVIAWDGSDYETIEFFENARNNPSESSKYDIHWRNAEIMMQRDRSTMQPTDRQIAKPTGFGCWYDMSPIGIQRSILTKTDPPLYIDLQECAHRRELFRLNAPHCFDRQERIKNEVLRTGKQKSPTGFEVTYHSIVTDPELKFYFGKNRFSEKDPKVQEVLRSAYSLIPQNVVMYLIGRSMVKLNELLTNATVGRLVLQVHDSILIEIKDDLDYLCWIFNEAKRIMESPFVINSLEMIIPIDCKIGYSWKGDKEKITTVEQLISSYNELQDERRNN